MKRILEILMEIETLTPMERGSVQANLSDLRSHTVGMFTQPGQLRYSFLL